MSRHPVGEGGEGRWGRGLEGVWLDSCRGQCTLLPPSSVLSLVCEGDIRERQMLSNLFGLSSHERLISAYTTIASQLNLQKFSSKVRHKFSLVPQSKSGLTFCRKTLKARFSDTKHSTLDMQVVKTLHNHTHS